MKPTESSGDIPGKTGFAARLFEIFRKNFLAGLILLIPVFVTIYVFLFVGKLMQLFPIFSNSYINYLINIPVTVVIILIFGVLARNLVGRRVVDFGESILVRIPVAKSIYMTIKQILNTFLMRDSVSFRKVVMVEYPRKGIYSLAFVTGRTMGELREKIGNRTESRAINIFVPTTPNPTSGFYLVVPEEDLVSLDMSVEDAFRIIISAGVLSDEQAREILENAQMEQAVPAGDEEK